MWVAWRGFDFGSSNDGVLHIPRLSGDIKTQMRPSDKRIRMSRFRTGKIVRQCSFRALGSWCTPRALVLELSNREPIRGRAMASFSLPVFGRGRHLLIRKFR